jgi:multiple sugar transport system substrate-binding protein
LLNALLALVTLLILGCGLLTGCTLADVDTNVTTLTLSCWGTPTEKALLSELAKGYQALHPTVRVKVQHSPDNYFAKLHLLMAARHAPDVMMLNSLTAPTYAATGQLLPLDAWLAQQPAPNGAQAYAPAALAAMQATLPSGQTALVALPRDISTLAVVVNTSLLRQALGAAQAEALLARATSTNPTTLWRWDEAVQVATTVQERLPRVKGWSFYSSPPLYWLPFVWSWGGQWLTDAQNPLVDEADTAAWQGLQAYADLRHRWRVAPGLAVTGQTPMTQLFIKGELLFMLAGPWTMPFLREQAPFAWDIVRFPQGPAGSRVGVDASGFAVWAHTPHPQQALGLLGYLNSAKAQASLAQSGLILPARVEVAQAQAKADQAANLPPYHAEVWQVAVAEGIPTHTPAQWHHTGEALTERLRPWFEQGQRPQAQQP